MKKNIKYISAVIVCNSVLFWGQMGLAQVEKGTIVLPEGKSSSASSSITPAMIAEQEKKQAELVKTQGDPRVQEEVKSMGDPSKLLNQGNSVGQAPSTDLGGSAPSVPYSENSGVLGYAVVLLFIWLVGITAFLLKRGNK